MDLVLVPIAISTLPGLLAVVLIASRKPHSWLVVLLGGAGWLLALLLRTPLLFLIQGLKPVFQAIVASFLAGVFEEGARFLLLRTSMVRGDVMKGSVLLGLGWGLTEATLIYAIPVLTLTLVAEYNWVDLLPGAFERNSAIIVHLSLSTLLARNPWSYKLLVLAVTLHAVFNLVGVTALYMLRNAWLVELVIAITALAFFTSVAYPSVKYLEQLKREQS